MKKRLQCCLVGARGHPLELHIANDDAMNRFFSTLAPYSTQWRTFSFRTMVPISFPMDDIRGRIPLLRALNIGMDDG
jgi:hypothetical protein